MFCCEKGFFSLATFWGLAFQEIYLWHLYIVYQSFCCYWTSLRLQSFTELQSWNAPSPQSPQSSLLDQDPGTPETPWSSSHLPARGQSLFPFYSIKTGKLAILVAVAEAGEVVLKYTGLTVQLKVKTLQVMSSNVTPLSMITLEMYNDHLIPNNKHWTLNLEPIKINIEHRIMNNYHWTLKI